MSIRFFSVNIERNKHLDRIEKFLHTQNADVVCMQEVLECDLERLSKYAGKYFVFTPMSINPIGNGSRDGIAIFSSLPLIEVESHVYAGAAKLEREFDRSSLEGKYQTQQYLITLCRLIKDNQSFQIGTTHFPWTESGSTNDFQRDALKSMLTFLEKFKDVIFCGDFNAPRGREIFSAIAEKYTDNIPAHYETSLDKDLHRAGYLPYVVDGLFSTPNYKLENVELVFGVSDHAGIVANIHLTDNNF